MVMSNGDMLSREGILGADDLKCVEVDVPEWGGSVWVRTMTGTERDAFEAKAIGAPLRDIRARLAVATVCTKDGQLLFTESDVPAIARKSARALDRIFAVSGPMSGLTKDDIAELKKSSSTIPSSDSSTS